MFPKKRVAFFSMSASVITTSSSSESGLGSGIGRLSTDSTYSLGSDSDSEGEVTESESQWIGDCTTGTWNLLGSSGKRILPLKIRSDVSCPVTGSQLSTA